MTENGVLLAQVIIKSASIDIPNNPIVLLNKIADKEGVLSPQHRMIPYPLPDYEPSDVGRRRGSNDKLPIDIVLTPFHLAMVFYDRIRIVCTVSQQLVYDDAYDQVRMHIIMSRLHIYIKILFIEFRRLTRVNLRRSPSEKIARTHALVLCRLCAVQDNDIR